MYNYIKNLFTIDVWGALDRANHVPEAFKKLLIENNITDLNKYKGDDLPLTWAVKNNNIEIAKILIDSGANIRLKDKHGDTPLALAMILNNENMIELFQYHETNQIPPKIKNEISIWDAFSRSGFNADAFEKIIKENNVRDFNEVSQDGKWLPLGWASYADIYPKKTVQMLIDKGADVNFKDGTGSTALMWAMKKDRLAIAKLLLNNGANPKIKNNDQDTALTLAEKLGNEAIIDLIQTQIQFDEFENVDELKLSTQPLISAISDGDLVTVKRLVNYGADVNPKNLPDKIPDIDPSKIPLILAIMLNNKEIINFLIMKGANVNIQDSTGMTPIMWATKKGLAGTAQLLIENGADILIKDLSGKDALMHAQEAAHPGIESLLRENISNATPRFTA